MNSTFDFGPEDDRDDGGRDGAGRSIVYIRAVPIAELPDEVREAAGDVTELYALHSAQKSTSVPSVSSRISGFSGTS